MPPQGVFVTGTDTGVGKTVASAVLACAWSADYWKPVQTGLDEEAGDTATVAALAGLGPGRLHPPRHAYGPPLSPHVAARGAPIRLDDFALPASPRPLIVEGAGGALVPLNERERMIDLMVRLSLPVVVVAADRLGAINHTLLTLEALRGRALEVLGVVMTGDPFADNARAIAHHGATRILSRLEHAPHLGPEAVARWARSLPPLNLLAHDADPP